MLLVASKVWVRYKILGQASTLLPLDIDSLQQLDKMHGQNMADSAYITSHMIMSYLLWPPPASSACLGGPVAILKQGLWAMCMEQGVPSPQTNWGGGWGGGGILLAVGQTSGQ